MAADKTLRRKKSYISHWKRDSKTLMDSRCKNAYDHRLKRVFEPKPFSTWKDTTFKKNEREEEEEDKKRELNDSHELEMRWLREHCIQRRCTKKKKKREIRLNEREWEKKKKDLKTKSKEKERRKGTRQDFTNKKEIAPTHHMTRPVSILRGVQIYLSGTR